ncbi:MAG: hypothetical protein Q8R87_11615 [Anaerolineaceae bacterium]|nr:hypothetical protein [Anaerolineaceae bacterium]
MRVTRDILLNLAKENAAKLTAKDRGLVCVYLTGSLLHQDPFIGGVTDIDLICVHDRPVATCREIVRINADVHLDIAHYPQETFSPARKQRRDPWICGALDLGAISLQDSTHWFDLTRSSAISQFWQPANVAARSRLFLDSARQDWQALEDGSVPQGIKRIQVFVNAVRKTANAAACLSGMPLTVRRLFVDLPDRAEKAGLPDLTGDLVHLFTSIEVTDESWQPWLAGLNNTFEALSSIKTIPPSINPNRRNYYEKAILALSEERPAAAVWVLLDVWTLAATLLPKTEASYKEWQAFSHQLKLDSKTLPTRLDALDAALDKVEEVVETL